MWPKILVVCPFLIDQSSGLLWLEAIRTPLSDNLYIIVTDICRQFVPLLQRVEVQCRCVGWDWKMTTLTMDGLASTVTKAAEINLMKGLATICGPNIRCNSVSPGLMMTEWGRKFPESKVKATKEKGVLQSLATVEDAARSDKNSCNEQKHNRAEYCHRLWHSEYNTCEICDFELSAMRMKWATPYRLGICDTKELIGIWDGLADLALELINTVIIPEVSKYFITCCVTLSRVNENYGRRAF